MSMKRSPISASGATFALTLLAAFATQAVEARTCGYDRFGRYRCTGLLGGTIGGIIAAAVGGLLLLLLLLLCVFRRRRSRRANQAYVNQPQPPMQQPQGYYGPGPTQYPTEQASYGNGQYGQQQTYAPPNSPPPVPAYSGSANYAPPPGPPPAAHVAGGGGEAAGYYGNRSAV